MRIGQSLLKNSKFVLEVNSVNYVVLLTGVFYVIFVVTALGIHDWNPLWFVWTGEKYANLDPSGRTGYDGQFVYYIARYGQTATPHLDNPPYRLQRILLPAIIRILSFGYAVLIPWLIIAVNFFAIVISAYHLGQWLSKNNISPWYVLTYTLYVGLFMAFSRDLTEPLAFSLAALGAISWLQKKYQQAILFLALAALTKETTLLFVFGIAGSVLIRYNLKLALLASTALLPLLVWEGYLFVSFNTIPLTAGPSLENIPLYGLIPHLNSDPARLSSFLFVGLPALLFLPVSLGLLLQQGGSSPTAWWLLLHCILIILLPFDVYEHIMHASRNAIGLVLSVLFLMPFLAKPIRLLTLGYWVLPTFVWLIPVLRWAPWSSTI